MRMNLRTAFPPILALAGMLAALPAYAEMPPAQIAPVQLAQDGELAYWNGIKDRKKPEDYQGYLDKYPNGTFPDLAKLRVKKYAPAEPAPAPAEAPADPQQQDIAYWNSIKASKKADDYKA